ncbi:Similar to alpha-ketoglutarate-dependent taurine dioxygenase (fragment) [Xenorhabdus bovienii str. oregonense]|uniref:Similar to alpha-ketoglutarate-dependent taurine dioxygenase n=1 Tax=Xenorhabdus bovienii str. oregonense TaxID=1398202 RepID=A0A077PDV9_XENBV
MSDKNKYTIRKLSPYFCAEIRGIDLNGPLDDEMVKAIRSDLEAHEVLVFPEQDLTSEDLMRLGRYFGPLTVHPFAENSEKNPELIVFDYKDGNPSWHAEENAIC